jgi:hypothetical protein
MFSLFRKINNIKIILYNTREYPVQKRKKMEANPEAPNYGKISRLNQNPVTPICQQMCKFRKFPNIQISVKIKGFVRKFRPIYLL